MSDDEQISKWKETIPQELQELPQWVVWNADKQPIDPNTGYWAKSNDPSTWSSLDHAIRAYKKGLKKKLYKGIGFQLAGQYCGIDLDKKMPNGTTFNPVFLDADSRAIIKSVNSYTHFSPSGTGIHIIFKADLAPILEKFHKTNKPKGFELYTIQFFTVTDRVITKIGETEISANIEHRQQEVEQFAEKYLEPIKAAPKVQRVIDAGITLEDKTILERVADKYKKILDADYTDNEKVKADGTPDWSALVPSILCGLYMWTQDDEQVERILLTSKFWNDPNNSKWRDEKWSKRREEELNKAKQLVASQYNSNMEQLRKNELIEFANVASSTYEADQPEKPKSKSNDDVSELIDEALKQTLETTKPRPGYTIRTFCARPKPLHIVKNHIVRNCKHMIYGKSGIGKSFYALDMALCIVSGKQFLNRWHTKPGKVLYLVSESDGCFQVRLEGWQKHNNIDLYDNENICLLPYSYNFQNEKETIESLQDSINTNHKGFVPDVIFTDTVFPNIGGDENNPKDMNKFINTCEAVMKHFGGAAMALITHEGKDNGRGARGHSSLDAACQSVINISGDYDGTFVNVYQSKFTPGKSFGGYILDKVQIEVDPLDEDYKDTLVYSYAGEGLSVDEKLVTISKLFSDAESTAETVKTVFNANKEVFNKFNWALKTAQNNIGSLVEKGLLIKTGKGKYYRTQGDNNNEIA